MPKVFRQSLKIDRRPAKRCFETRFCSLGRCGSTTASKNTDTSYAFRIGFHHAKGHFPCFEYVISQPIHPRGVAPFARAHNENMFWVPRLVGLSPSAQMTQIYDAHVVFIKSILSRNGALVSLRQQ